MPLYSLNSAHSLASSALEGVTIYAYGHSMQASDAYNGGTGAGGRASARMASRARGTLVTRATNGRRMLAASGAACTVRDAYAGGSAWVPGTRGLVTMISTINDVSAGGANAELVKSHKEAVRSFLALTRSQAIAPAASAAWVYSPGWTSSSTNLLTSTNRFETGSTGAYAQVKVVGDKADLVLSRRSTGSGTYTITSDGTTVANIDLTGTVGIDYTPTVVALTGLGSGTHTIRITLASGSYLGVEALLVPSPTPTPTVVVGEGPYNNATVSTQLLPWLVAVADACAEFPHTVYLPASSLGWDYNVHSIDGTHPNDLGASILATGVLAALANLPWTNGVGRLADVAAYSPPTPPSIPSGGQDGAGTINGTTLALDSFTRADSASLGSTETGALAWGTDAGDTWGIASGKLACTAVTGGDADALVDTGQAGGTVKVTLATIPTGAGAGLLFRISQSHATGYLIYTDQRGAQYKLMKRNAAGNYTQLAITSGVSSANGDVVSAVLSGSSIACYVNGTQVMSVTDASYTGTLHGMWAVTGAAFDDFSHVVGSAVPAADTFNRANGSMGSTSTGSKAWAANSAAGWAIASNAAAWTGTGDGQILINSGVSGPYEVGFTAVSVTGQYPIAIIPRGTSASSYLLIYRNQAGDTWTLADTAGGSSSVSSATDIANGDLLTCRVEGTTLTLFLNGKQVGQWTGITGQAGGTFQGIGGSGNIALTVDNFVVAPV